MQTGIDGELTACAYLRCLGYEVLFRNLKLGRDEVDILARDPVDDVLVFAEVKSRKVFSEDYRPEMNLTRRKRAAMSRAVRTWAARNDYDGGYRMDLICVAGGKVVDHYKQLDWGVDRDV